MTDWSWFLSPPSIRACGSPAHGSPTFFTAWKIPYGVCDIGANNGFVNAAITKGDRRVCGRLDPSWWQQLGQARYPDARTLQITADCGGGNDNRTRLRKTELQRLADDTRLEISVCHFPPGTSKWNKIEHRLWSLIAKNWRGRRWQPRGHHPLDRRHQHDTGLRG